MNKKEVLEIRKQFTPANCALTRIACCYVNHEKEKVTQTREAFLSLPEEEAFKYFDIFRKSLSGNIGKNLLNYDFTTKEELDFGMHKTLMDLRNSKLQDDELLNFFYDTVIESYDCNENYYIVLVHGMYDIPGKASDGEEMFDASEEVYDFILCCICPVKLSKAGLSYDSEHNEVKDRIRDWIVGQPDVGFLFPAFNGRSTDIHSSLIYTRKLDELPYELISRVIGENIPDTCNEQKLKFNQLIEDVLGKDCTFDTVSRIYSELNELHEEHKDDAEPYAMDMCDIGSVFEKAGTPKGCMDFFGLMYDKWLKSSEPILLSNLVTPDKNTLVSGKTKIVMQDHILTDVEFTVNNGKKYIMIPIYHEPEINGIYTKA